MREVSFPDGATASPLLASVLPGRPVSLLCEAAETEAEEAEPGRGQGGGGARAGQSWGWAGAEPGRGAGLRRGGWGVFAVPAGPGATASCLFE